MQKKKNSSASNVLQKHDKMQIKTYTENEWVVSSVKKLFIC